MFQKKSWGILGRLISLPILFSALFVLAGEARAQQSKPPVIEHAPVTVALRGQPVAIRATVTDESKAVKSVTLYYTTSKDVAPFKISLQKSGADSYTGVIPAQLLSGNNQVSYYIEAMNEDEVVAETPWYTVNVKSLTAAESAAKAAPAEQQRQVKPGEQKDRTPGWVVPACVIGGAGVVAGGVLWAVNSHGGGGDDHTTTNAGTYVGTVTTCFQLDGSNSHCNAHSLAIFIDKDGNVSSYSLREGEYLSAKMSGEDFLMISAIDTPDETGSIRFQGTVVGGRIVGSIEGSSQTASGHGTYSGNFTAYRK